MPTRIPASELRQIRRQLFEGRYTATALARRLRMSANTFWITFHRDNGITTDFARAIGNVLFEWALKLNSLGLRLLELADSYDDLARQQAEQEKKSA